ncbi:hypothetical protein [Gilliamella apicola]|uniref:Uncharacterized protein n=1 Tax=Gilliamella apicola TaxID=1196095 RepID=A0A242NK90_9GAMM|nr:hypothetical protein [Gilliamella apicola]OTP83237.1 hypothetical protein B5S40_03775 [Gilliamella apicola]OTP84625.1 hypothetical protein B5S44_09380 [Gilliamella apicola]OTQ00796.1 hypothetical protein B6D08_02925 [Gilliamella apicola]OTQ11096.1 hypothetical protein B6C91_03480 [Gilliamella apicola]OTQ17613.1 hypothetical protein B6D11_02015 [Gilliamella apicola]
MTKNKLKCPYCGGALRVYIEYGLTVVADISTSGKIGEHRILNVNVFDIPDCNGVECISCGTITDDDVAFKILDEIEKENGTCEFNNFFDSCRQFNITEKV